MLFEMVPDILITVESLSTLYIFMLFADINRVTDKIDCNNRKPLLKGLIIIITSVVKTVFDTEAFNQLLSFSDIIHQKRQRKCIFYISEAHP